MFAYLVAVADPARFDALARPGIDRTREADSPTVTVPADPREGPQRALNAALDRLAGEADLEGVILLHEDVVLLDPGTLPRLRATFADPGVALAGAIGATGVQSLAWWDGFATGSAQTPHVPGGVTAGVRRTGTVDALDGIVLCLSPWAVRTLRFDVALAGDFHGYDVDLCFQARHHGRRVEVIDLPVRHEHRPLFTDPARWARNEQRFRQRWLEHRPLTTALHRELYEPH